MKMSSGVISLCCLLQANLSAIAQSNLFDQETPLELTLSGDLGHLMKDRGDAPQYHPVTLTYQSAEGSKNISIKSKVRGHFRKMQENCNYPPLSLNFTGTNHLNGTVFEGQEKIKLVTPCRDEKYVVREYLVYKLYNLVTPKSFKTRLVKVIYDDTVKGKKSLPLFGILLEEESQVAARNKSILVGDKIVRPEQTQPEDFFKMAVFEYLIGNTDWSVQYRQNVKLLASDSMSIPSAVPYDFDHAGIVGAPYAKPAEQLELASTRQRRYRGYCMSNLSKLDPAFAQFNQLKKDIYSVYTDCPWLDEKYIGLTTRYLDEFFETINDPKKVKEEFGYPCRKNGTGNVVITGLDKK